MGLVSVGILGLVFGAAVGKRCAWCQSAACADTRWWACQSTEQPTCSYIPMGNGTASIDCTGVCSSSPAARLLLPFILHLREGGCTGLGLYQTCDAALRMWYSSTAMDPGGCSELQSGESMAFILEGQCCLLGAGGLYCDARQLQRQPCGHGAGGPVQARMPGGAASSTSAGARAAPARNPHLDPTPSPLMKTMHVCERTEGIIGCTCMYARFR